MKTLLYISLALGLAAPLACAQKSAAATKEKPAAESKKSEPNKEAPGELSDSDKQLLADAKKEADALTPAQRTKLMELLNKGDAKALEAVEGIGEVRAKNLIAKRPFKKAEDAAMVDGIGIETFKNLCASVKPAKPASGKPKIEKPAEKSVKPKVPVKPVKKPE